MKIARGKIGFFEQIRHVAPTVKQSAWFPSLDYRVPLMVAYNYRYYLEQIRKMADALHKERIIYE